MDMSDDNGVTHHAQRDDSYSFLSDIERSAVERMGSTVGKDAIMAILSVWTEMPSIQPSPSSYNMNLTRRGKK